MEKRFWVYITTDKPYGTVYAGITNNLARRIWEHKEGLVPGFAKKHGLNQLVYYEEYATAIEAISHEKAVKKWRREWKIEKIAAFNPTWNDLYQQIQN